MFILFCNFSFSQSQPIKLSWTGEVGCQQYDEEEEPKDPRETIFIEDISDSECYRFCENNSANYTLTFLPAGSTVTWSVIGGTIIYNNPSNTSCLVLWGDAGNGSLTVNISNNNGIITKSLCVEKINSPIAQFAVNNVITPNGETAFACTQQMLYFSNLMDTNNGTALVSFYWDFGDGTFSNAENPTHSYSSDQDYFVTLTVTNACNCTSTYEMFVAVNGRGFNISCPSVVCENQTEIYSLPFDEKEICEDAASNWIVSGGTIISQGGGNVAVNWDNADGGLNATGFGYVTFNPTNCSIDCMEPTTIKVPVIMQNGTIEGKTTICTGKQERYSLPQWPTTEIVWSIVNDPNETTASIIQTDQRNEIIVTPANGFTGTIVLRAVYKNTLLNCGGEAQIIINVSNPAAINGEELLCVGGMGIYSDNNGNNYIDFKLYDSNNSLVATGLNNLQYTFTTPGDYYVVASGQNICETIKNIKVIANPTPPTGINGVPEVCPNVPETFTVQSPEPNSIYVWAITNGTIIGSNTGTTVTAAFNGLAPGNISVVRQTINPISCSSSAVNKTVNIKTVAAQISGTLNVCANSVSDFEIQNPNNTLFIDPEVTYEWSLSNPLLGSISNGQGTNQIQVTWNNTTSPQTCDVLVAIKKCTLPEVFTTTVTVQPAPTISIAPATQTICAGQSASFTINSSIPLAVGTQVQWTFGGITQTGGLTHNFVFSNNTANITSKTVTAIILNPNGCDGTATNLATAEIDVKPQPGATLSLSSSFGNVFCTKFQINAQVTIASSITGVTIQWYHQATNGTLTALPFSGNVMPLTSGFGAYYFTATNSFGCTKDSNKIYIIQSCDGEPPTCTIPNNPQVINNATNTCGVLQLNSIATPNPISSNWTIIGPQNAINYTLPTLDVVPGLYNVFYNANYYCTSGQIGTITKNKQIVVPYKANLSHTVTCSGNNSFAISLIDLSVFYAEVTNQSAQFYYAIAGSNNWIATGPNVTLTAGTYDFKVVNNGSYQGNPQPSCEYVTQNITLQSIGNLNITYLPTPNIPCHDTAVKFGVSGIPNPTYTYIWTFDIGTPQEVTNTMANPFKTFTTPGIHTVNVTVKNPNGCQKILNQITVDIPNPCFAGDITATQNPACANSTVTLSYNNSSDAGCNGVVYQWMKGTTPFATTPIITVQENGLYWLKLESSDFCSYEAPTRIPVQFITPPSVHIKGNNTFCEGEFIELTAITQANTIRWYINNSATPVSGTNNQTSVSLTNLPVGNHSIKVEVWDSANGCVNTVIYPITIVPVPSTVNIIINDIQCEPYGVSLSASMPGNPANVSYNWSNGASGSTIWMNEGGPIKVTATVGGCSVSSQMFVPKSPESYLWVFPSGCFDDCIKESGYLVGPTTPFAQWAWNQDGQINNSGNQSFTDPITLFDDGSYSLTLDNGSCEATAASLDFTTIDCRACPLEMKEIINIKRANTPFCSYNFSFVLSSNLPITYQATVTEEANVIFNPSTITILPGNNQYDFNVIPTNNFNGGTIHITIQGTYLNPKSGEPTTCIYEFDVEFPPCDGFQAKKIIGNDLESLKNAITLYPNPTQNLVNLQYDLANDNTSVYVYDLSGRMMYSAAITDIKGNLELNTSTFEAGIYIVVLKQNNEIINQQKLIKK